jgi:hypothetical protein
MPVLDFGCAQSIIDGKIKVKSGVEIDRFEKKHVVLADGSRIEADVVVLAYALIRSDPFRPNIKSMFTLR